jgi:hypothetical protein
MFSQARTTGEKKRLHPIRGGLAALGLVGAVSAACITGAVPASAAVKAPTIHNLKVNRHGVPNLHGVTFPLGKGAGAPHVGDAVTYTAQQLLGSWGAKVGSLTLGEGPAVVSGVVGGHLFATGGPFTAELNGGLKVFGPSQPGEDYEFIVAKGIKNFSQLKGKVVGVSAPGVGDAVLMAALEHKYHLTGQVTIEYTGSATNSVSAFIGGRLSGFWTNSTSAIALTQQHVYYKPMISARALLPAEADSYEAATSSWLKSHLYLAEAYDLAWLYAARIFNTNEARWLKYAADYTDHSVPVSQMKLAYAAYKKEQLFPDNASAFNPANVKANYKIAEKTGTLDSKYHNKPESAYATFKAWQAAVKIFRTHPKSY